MAAPATVPDFFALIYQSGLLDQQAIAKYLQKPRARVLPTDNPAVVAMAMVKDGLLTTFQAEQLLQGRWRRFRLGRYKVLELIGAGGMGTVYLCEHMHMKRKVAVKVLPPALATNPSCRERFLREGRAISALDHPNIVKAYDMGHDDDLPFLAMEYVEGSSLQALVKTQGPLSVLQAIHYMRQAALGLEHAHQLEIVHRDIKPANLLVDLTGTVKVLDLGLARIFSDTNDDLSVRHEESVLGTADYLAPEQAINSHDVDTRADIYALGCTFYFCLTGRPPFPEGTVTQKLLGHQQRQPTPIRQLRPDVPRDFAAVLEKTMAKKAEHRYQTPAELAKVLAQILAQNGETAVGGGDKTLTRADQWQTNAPRRFWRRAGIWASLALVPVVVLLLGWVGWKNGVPASLRPSQLVPTSSVQSPTKQNSGDSAPRLPVSNKKAL